MYTDSRLQAEAAASKATEAWWPASARRRAAGPRVAPRAACRARSRCARGSSRTRTRAAPRRTCSCAHDAHNNTHPDQTRWAVWQTRFEKEWETGYGSHRSLLNRRRQRHTGSSLLTCCQNQAHENPHSPCKLRTSELKMQTWARSMMSKSGRCAGVMNLCAQHTHQQFNSRTSTASTEWTRARTLRRA